MKIKLFATFLFFSIFAFSQQREYFSYHYTTNNGLPSNTVYDIFEDKKGFIWIASSEGLFRFDGVNYKSFKANKSFSLIGSNIYQNSSGVVFYQSFDGRIMFVEDDSLKLLEKIQPQNYIPFFVANNEVYSASENSIKIFDSKSKSISSRVDLNMLQLQFICGNNEYLIFNQVKKLHIYKNKKLQKILESEKFDLPISKPYITNNYLYLLERFAGTISLVKVNLDNYQIQTFEIENQSLIQNFTIIDKILFVATSNGLLEYEFKNNNLVLKRSLFQGKSISKIYKDSNQNLWVTSTSEGVWMVSNNSAFVITTPNSSPVLLANYKGDTLLISDSKYNILKYNYKQSEFDKDTVFRASSEIYLLKYFPNNDALFIGADKFYSKVNKQLLEHLSSVKDIIEIKDNQYAFATSANIGIYCTKNIHPDSIWFRVKTLNSVSSSGFEMNFIKNNIRAKSVLKVDENNFLCATNNGLYNINRNAIYELKRNGEPILAQSLFLTNSKKIILYESNNDLSYITLNGVNAVFQKINFFEAPKKVKLIGNYLSCLQNNQLVFTNLEMENVVNIQNIDAQHTSDWTVVDGMLLILTNSGIIQMPFKNELNLMMPKVFITELRLNNEKVRLQPTIEIPQSSNNFTIDFSIIDFNKNNNISIWYSIKDSIWIPIKSNQRQLNLPSLSAGVYDLKFKIKSMQKERLYGHLIKINVMPKIWQTWWFLSLVFLLFTATILLYFKWQMQLLKQQNKLLNKNVELQKNLNQSQLTAIKSQMNPHFFYNALNTIQAYIFVNDKLNASKYLSKFSNLTRQVLEMTGKDSVTLFDEINSIELYLELEKMRFGDNFNYRIEVEKNLEIELILIPPMIIQPHIENALKHGLLHKKGDQVLNIHMNQSGKFLIIGIDDNGIGRKKSNEINAHKKEKPKSFAINANNARIEILNQNLEYKISMEVIDKYDDNAMPEGTLIKLKIPIK